MSALIGNPLLLTSAPADDDAYQIEKSLRLDSGDGAYLNTDNLAASGNVYEWTWSAWVKRTKLAKGVIWGGGEGSDGHDRDGIFFQDDDTLVVYWRQGGTTQELLQTNRVFRDTNAWYHIVWSFNQNVSGTSASGKSKVYINGELITDWQHTFSAAVSKRINTVGHGFWLGKTPAGDNVDILVTDMHFIDGLALSPAAFGSFDSTGAWNPKAFALPAPNDGTTWSSSLTTEGDDFESGYPATKLFDGYLTTVTASDDGGQWIKFSPSGGISYNQSVRVYQKNPDGSDTNDTTFTLTDTDGTVRETKVADNAGLWTTLHAGKGTFTELKAEADPGPNTPSTNWTYWAAIEVDGVILRDGQTDLTTRKNPNDGRTWSDLGTASGTAYSSSFNHTKVFDGDALATQFFAATGPNSATFTFDTSISNYTKLEMYISGPHNNLTTGFKLNGVDKTSAVIDVHGNGGVGWVDIGASAFLNGAALSSFEVYSTAGNTYVGIQGIKVDGHLLIDGARDNTHHLKLTNAATNASLGLDTLVRDTNDTSQGGSILKTEEGSQGATLDSGYNTDSKSSSLVVAIPANNATDVHHSIKGSGSAKTVTYTGTCSASTAESKYYGTSTYVKDDGYIKISQTNDCLFSGQLTIEGWFYSYEGTNNRTLVWSDGTGDGRYLVWLAASKLTLVVYESNSPSVRIQGTTIVKTGKWYHMAFCRDSNDLVTLYLDGVNQGTWDSSSFTPPIGGTDNDTVAPEIGSQDGGNGFNGYLQDWRFYTTCKYTTGFQPQKPLDFTVNNLTHDDGTDASTTLANATGGLPIYNTTGTWGGTKGSGYRDDNKPDGTTSVESNIVLAIAGDAISDEHDEVKGSGSAKALTNNSGNVSVVDDPDIFYGKALQFGSSNHYLTTPAGSNSDFDMGSGDFTIECWVYADAVNSNSAHFLSMWEGSGTLSMYASDNGQQKLGWGLNAGAQRTAWDTETYPLKTWVHFAGVRDGNLIRCFVNGKEKANTAGLSTASVCGTFTIGRMSDNASAYWDGKLAGIRVYKGVAKYTSDFKPVQNFVDPTTQDSLVDSPTSYGTDTGAGGEVRGNYCTINPLDHGLSAAATITQGNLTINSGSSNWKCYRGTMGVSTGKWYYEVYWNGGGEGADFGIIGADKHLGLTSIEGNGGWQFAFKHRDLGAGAADVDDYFPTGPAQNKAGWWGVAVDMDAGKLWAHYQGTWGSNGGVGDPAAGTYAGATNLSGTVCPAWSGYYNGEASFNFGQRPWKYTCPTGFQPWCTTNLPDTFSGTALNNPSKYFNVTTYKGIDADQTIHIPGLSPEFVWIKEFSAAQQHQLYDVIRGSANNYQRLELQGTDDGDTLNSTGEELKTAGVQTFNSNGFDIGDNPALCESPQSYVAWCWDAGSSAATPKSGVSGQNITATASWVNTAAGFEILTYQGADLNTTRKLGHNLGAIPEFIIFKNRDTSNAWCCYHKEVGNGDHIRLNTLAQVNTDTLLDSTDPTNELITLGDDTNVWDDSASGNEHVAYIWTGISGYSKFGSYEGNSSSDGTFVYTGFRPRYLWIKRSTGNGDWQFIDAARDLDNPVKALLSHDTPAQNDNTEIVDFLSNGFKLRASSDYRNTTGQTYLYGAWAEHPFKTTRAR